MANSLPARWLEYKPFGDTIQGTKIMAFKVPLKETLCNSLTSDQRFTPAMLRESVPRLKYVIDLTNTDRYYDRKEFIDSGIKYQKVMIPGITIPSMDCIERFFKAMDVFLSTCGEDEIIGVHCTHGVNRTGFLICKYLIQQMDWNIEDTLKAFEEARGHKIERGPYVEALKLSPKGLKIDTSKMNLSESSTCTRRKRHGPPIRTILSRSTNWRSNECPKPYSRYGPPRFASYGGGGQGLRSMPPPLFGPNPRFRPPIPSLFHNNSRIVNRVPPRPPPPPPPLIQTAPIQRSIEMKRKNKQPPRHRIGHNNGVNHSRHPRNDSNIPKLINDQDFTIDTFEENLLTSPTVGNETRARRGGRGENRSQGRRRFYRTN